MRDFGDDVFAGTAKYYAQYRTDYPKSLLKDIITAFELRPTDRLLDLGCGTGELAIPLANYFKKVVAIDPDQEMLDIGRRKAKKAKITNISWQRSSSKELNQLNEHFSLVTMGRSFHWMDQETVLKELYGLLEKGGGVAVVGTEPVKQELLTAKKDKIIQKLIKKYLGPERRAGSTIYIHPERPYQQLLSIHGFKNFKQHHYDVISIRNIGQTLGFLYSLSWSSKKHFGDQAKAFEHELKDQLEAINPDGIFRDKIRFELCTISK